MSSEKSGYPVLRLAIASFEGLAGSRLYLTAALAALGGAALMLTYAMLLSRIGMRISVPVLFAVLIASSISSTVGFAFSAICGAMLLHLMHNQVRMVEIMFVSSIAIQLFSVAAPRFSWWVVPCACRLGSIFF
ncbi:MAG: hypothetical protein ACREE5_03270 [Acetobacteraceae bacterium]